jgi:hypothetical protein
MTIRSFMSHALPTHTALAAAVSEPSVPGGRPQDPLRKYIIVADDAGNEHPLVFAREIQHNRAVPAHMQPVSAGFVVLHQGRVMIPAIGSESLRLDPRPQDKNILQTFLS